MAELADALDLGAVTSVTEETRGYVVSYSYEQLKKDGTSTTVFYYSATINSVRSEIQLTVMRNNRLSSDSVFDAIDQTLYHFLPDAQKFAEPLCTPDYTATVDLSNPHTSTLTIALQDTAHRNTSIFNVNGKDVTTMSVSLVQK